MRAIVPFRFAIGEWNRGLGAAKRGRRFLKEPGHATQPVQALLLTFFLPDPRRQDGLCQPLHRFNSSTSFGKSGAS